MQKRKIKEAEGINWEKDKRQRDGDELVNTERQKRKEIQKKELKRQRK